MSAALGKSHRRHRDSLPAGGDCHFAKYHIMATNHNKLLKMPRTILQIQASVEEFATNCNTIATINMESAERPDRNSFG
jgi:hypothetical protein